MLLRDRILEIARTSGADRFATKRLESALAAVGQVIGDVDVLAVVGHVDFAQRVELPDDEAVYVVTGSWDDGTFDLVREQGSFPSDSLVGWRPGQSLRAYRAELDAEPLTPEIQNERRPRPKITLPGDGQGAE